MKRAYLFWTDHEKALLSKVYLTWTKKELEQRFHRRFEAIAQKAWQLGCARKHPRLAEHQSKLRRLHEQKLSDSLMAEKLGVSATTIRNWRHRLGIPDNCWTPEANARRQKGREKKWRQEGARCLADIYHSRERVEANRQWPGARTMREVKILQLLCKCHLTWRDIARITGLSAAHRSSQCWRLVRSLEDRGLMEAVRNGKHKVYLLASTARAMREPS